MVVAVVVVVVKRRGGGGEKRRWGCVGQQDIHRGLCSETARRRSRIYCTWDDPTWPLHISGDARATHRHTEWRLRRMPMHRLRTSASSPWACLANARTVRPPAWHQNRPTTLHCQRVWHGISRVRICSTAADCDLNPRLQLDRGVGESYPSSPRLRGGRKKPTRGGHNREIRTARPSMRAGANCAGRRTPASGLGPRAACSRCVLAHRTALQSPRPPFYV